MSDDAIFDRAIRSWAEAACQTWGYDPVGEVWMSDVHERLPIGLRSAVGRGLASGAIQVVDGFKFRLPNLPDEKGPYAWLGRSAAGAPAVHWEYYVQVAEYVRLLQAAGDRTVSFEDDLMDVTVYEDSALLLACEVKEHSEQVEPLLDGIRRYAGGFDPDQPDRGNDPLRKAKYISKARPRYFTVVALGHRREFSVEYHSEGSWTLVADVVPLN